MGERPANRFTVVRPAVAKLRGRPEIVTPEIVVGRGQRRHLGVELQSMTPQLAEYFGLSKRSGALVIFVFADSPAAKAGLKAGDVILSVGTDTVENPADLRRALTGKPETAEVDFKILRDKQEMTLKVKLEKGTSSWLLPPDVDDGDSQFALAPLAIEVPKFKLAPSAIKIPAVRLKPMKLQMPKWKLAPITIPQLKLEQMNLQQMNLEIPKIEFEQMNLQQMNLEIPKIELDQMNIEIPHVEFEKMNLQIPEFKLDPIKIVVAPRRIVL
jgi:membrane-associated protease RseP (regulator of RpoE activity)